MNFYGASNSIQVPTKTSTNGGGLSSSSDGNNSTNGNNMLRSRSNSSNSLDVAASIFSSMQDLEARGSNLSSILGRAGGVGNNGLTAAAMMGGGGGGMDPRLGTGMMGGGVSHQYHSLAAMASGAQQQARHPDPQIAALMEMQSSLSRRNTPDPMSNLLDGGAGPSSASMALQLRKLEMEEMLLKYQQNNRASLLDSLNGVGDGYNPVRGAGVAAGGVLPPTQMGGEGGGVSASRRGSNSSSILDEFTPEELLQEVTRRKSGLSSSIGDLYDTVLSRNNSREDLVGAMYNQMRAGSTSGTGRLSVGGLSPNSLDDLTALALAGKNGDKVLMEKLLQDKGGENNTGAKEQEEKKDKKDEADVEDEISGEVNSAPRIITVPTANPDAKLKGKKSSGSIDETSANSTVVTEDADISDIDDDKKSSNGDKKKRKRSDSTASFDALLSAFGDELTDLDKKKMKKAKEGKADGADNDDEDDKSAASSVNEQKDSEKKGDKDDISTAKEDGAKEMARPRSANSVGSLHSTSLEGGRSSAVQAQIDALLKRDAAAAGRGNNSSSINDALEAMRREEIMIRERRMHEQVILQRQRENAIRDMVLRQRHGLPPMGHPPMGLPPMAHHPQMGMPLPQQHLLPGSIPESEMARLAGLLEGRVPGVAPDLMRHPHAVLTQAGMSDAAALDMIARFQGVPAGFPPVHYVTAKPNRPKTKPAKVHKPPPPKVEWKNNNKEVLAQFLKDYGDEAKESIKRTLDVIAKSEKSVADLHAWDKAQGLRKCHSRTVVKTRRSRNALKAFLKGEDAPKEPVKQKRKKQKKREIQQIRVNLPFLVHC